MSKKYNFLLPLFLLATATCLQTYSYNYNQNASKANLDGKTILFGVTSGDVITFDIVFAPDTGLDPTQYSWSMYYANGTQISGVNGAAIPANLTVQHTFTAAQSADHIVDVKISGAFRSLRLYNMTATSSNGTILAKYTDVLRDILVKQIYLANTTSITVSNTDGLSFTFVVDMNADYPNFSIPGLAITSTGSNSTHANFTLTGYYIIYILAVLSSGTNTITYQSDTFPCRYNGAFPDTKEVFAPCFFDCAPGEEKVGKACTPCSANTFSAVGGLNTTCSPCTGCTTCDATNGDCQTCAPGESLTGTSCSACSANTFSPGGSNTTCSNCTGCATCDATNGDCLTCAPGESLTGTSCSACSANTFSPGGSNTTCSNCTGCATCDATNGDCLTCAPGESLTGTTCSVVPLQTATGETGETGLRGWQVAAITVGVVVALAVGVIVVLVLVKGKAATAGVTSLAAQSNTIKVQQLNSSFQSNEKIEKLGS